MILAVVLLNMLTTSLLIKDIIVEREMDIFFIYSD